MTGEQVQAEMHVEDVLDAILAARLSPEVLKELARLLEQFRDEHVG